MQLLVARDGPRKRQAQRDEIGVQIGAEHHRRAAHDAGGSKGNLAPGAVVEPEGLIGVGRAVIGAHGVRDAGDCGFVQVRGEDGAGAALVAGPADYAAMAIGHAPRDGMVIAAPGEGHEIGRPVVRVGQDIAADPVDRGRGAARQVVMHRHHLRVLVGAELGHQQPAQAVAQAHPGMAQQGMAHTDARGDGAGRLHLVVQGLATMMEGQAGVRLSPLMRKFQQDMARIPAT